jgi:membrane protein YdbS with pleckstrin-like domain
VNVPWMIAAIALVFAPALLFPMLISLFNISVVIPAPYVLIGTLFWYLATFGFVIVKFIGWYFNIYIVTNERIVDIDFINLLVKRFSQAELSRIQNITYSSSGIMATFFNYGNVIVETAGETPNIECTSVPNPDKVVEQIRSVSANSGRPE